MNGKPWLDKDEEILRRAYPDQSSNAIAQMLGCSLARVYARAAKLELKKSKAYLAANCRIQPGQQIGKAFQFPKGHAPANKGLRRPGYSIGRGRMQETQFKKGGRPSNWLPVGTIKPNADGYLQIKVSDIPEPPHAKGASSPNWEFVHRRVWEAAHGPIPKGHRIWWKDGDHTNCALENLELLTDQQHMARTTIHTLPPELKETIQLAGRLKRTIKRKERQHGNDKSA